MLVHCCSKIYCMKVFVHNFDLFQVYFFSKNMHCFLSVFSWSKSFYKEKIPQKSLIFAAFHTNGLLHHSLQYLCGFHSHDLCCHYQTLLFYAPELLKYMDERNTVFAHQGFKCLLSCIKLLRGMHWSFAISGPSSSHRHCLLCFSMCSVQLSDV